LRDIRGLPTGLLVGVILLVGGCASPWSFSSDSPAMAVGVSSDGRYAITTHRANELILWDIEAQEREKLADHANIYSAHFVSDLDAFLWQDLDDRVYVETVDGETLKSFEHFATYGHVIDQDLEYYLSANDTWSLFHGYGEDLRPVLRDSKSPSFKGSGKLLNLTLSGGDYFVTAGRGLSASDERPLEDDHPPVRPTDNLRFSSNYGGVVLWSREELKPVAKFSGNAAKTHATISPGGEWVVSGDENNLGFFWNTEKPDERHRMASYTTGIYQEDTPHEAGDPPQDGELHDWYLSGGYAA